MSGRDRAAFLGAYGPGVLLLVLAYVLFTAVRDFRDNFAAEIWAALGHAKAAAMFTATGRVGAAGFLIYVADASGYVGSVGLMLLKTFGSLRLDWLNFFILTAYGAALASVFMVALSGLYFGARIGEGGTGLSAGNTPETHPETTPFRP